MTDTRQITITTSELLDDDVELSMDEFCRACSGTTQWVIELVDEGVVEPVNLTAEDWRFTGTSLTRAQVAMRLHRDLDVNTPGIALALDLIDEIRRLRERVVNRRLDRQGDRNG